MRPSLYFSVTTQAMQHNFTSVSLEGVISPSLTSVSWQQADLWLWRVCPPVILVLGVLGNMAALATLTSMSSGWSSINVYLSALSVTDTLALLSGLLSLWLGRAWGIDVHASHPAACKILSWVMNFCASLSSWFVMTLTVQRAVSVLWPHKVKIICTCRRSQIAVLVLSTVFAVMYTHVLYGMDVAVVYRKGHAVVVCTFVSAGYSKFWNRVWTRVDLFLYSVIPAVTMVLGNSILAYTLAKSVTSASRTLTATTQSNVSEDRKKTASSTTVTVMAVSGTFLCLSLPFMIFNSMVPPQYFLGQDSRMFYVFVRNLLICVVFCNFSVNFYLYCLTGSRFREQFKTLVWGWRGKAQHSHHDLSKETSLTSASSHNTPTRKLY